MPRREFSKAVKVEIVKRATDAKGIVRCEECGCAPKRWDIDHTNPDALQIDKSKPLTAQDGKLLCAGSSESCHGRKTALDQGDIARAKRNEAKTLRVDKTVAPDRPMQGAPLPTTRKAAARAARGHRPSLPPLQLFRDARSS